jgi:hypothetical protein
MQNLVKNHPEIFKKTDIPHSDPSPNHSLTLSN